MTTDFLPHHIISQISYIALLYTMASPQIVSDRRNIIEAAEGSDSILGYIVSGVLELNFF